MPLQNEDYFATEPGRYQSWSPLGFEHCLFRGPPGSRPFACIGAAQTFGRRADNPYPQQLLADNFGLGGASPSLFCHPDWYELLNSYDAVVLQVMSARVCSTSEWQLLRDSRGWESVNTQLAGSTAESTKRGVLDRWEDLWATGDSLRCRRLIAEAQAAWIASTYELLDNLKPPVILHYFAKRTPEDYVTRFDTSFEMTGYFPHFVTREMLDAVSQRMAYVVEVIDPGDKQEYYPSQQGHDLAAKLLWEVLD